MIFSSLLFMFIYLPMVLVIYYVSPIKWRNIVLLLFNVIFYSWGEPIYIILMAFSIVVDYGLGLFLDKNRENPKKSKSIVVISVVFNIGLLVFFKYFDFIIENLSYISGLEQLEPLGLALPIGISFYTFQKLSYIIDVYRQESKAQKSFVAFASFVTLFPQLIAGPIIQYRDLENQLEKRKYSIEQFAAGVTIFVIGLGKKVLLANNIGMLWEVYQSTNVQDLSVLGAWLGALAFTFQIYFDFSGYSDMAIGIGRMLGFEFKPNFNYPYCSRSITDFWRRWHISLSSWFRDYVYIPLGGNRKGKNRWLINILIVWAATGLWHGASWNFLLWGIYYGILLILEKLFLLKWLEKVPRIVTHIYTMFFVIVGWVIFAIEDSTRCLSYIATMFGLQGKSFLQDVDLYYVRNYFAMFILVCCASLPIIDRFKKKMNDKMRFTVLMFGLGIVLLLSTTYLVDSTYNPFLYFRF